MGARRSSWRRSQNPDIDTLHHADGSGRWLGFAQLRAGKVSDGVPREGSIELWRFYVDKPFHGQGVAAGLMNGAKLRAQTPWREHAVAGRLGAQRAREGVLRQARIPEGGSQVFVVGTRSADRSRDALSVVMNVRLEHVGLWVRDLDGVAAFYEKYFGARIGGSTRTPARDSNRASWNSPVARV